MGTSASPCLARSSPSAGTMSSLASPRVNPGPGAGEGGDLENVSGPEIEDSTYSSN